MTTPSKNDYVVFRQGHKRFLMQVTGVTDQAVHGILDLKRSEGETEATCAHKDILAVLGPKPQNGSVFGVNIEPYWRRVVHDGFGQVQLYTRIDKGTWKIIRKGMDQAYAALEKERLTSFIEDSNLVTQLRPSKAKNLGMYHFRQRGDVAADMMMIRVQETQHHDLYREVILHECGHGVYYRLFSVKQRASWIRMHKKFAKFVGHDQADVRRLGKKFAFANATIAQFAEGLDETEALLFHECMSALRSNFRVRPQEINELIEAGCGKDILEMWPTDALDYTDFEQVLNEYATKNPAELFAESFRLYHTKTKLPKVIHELMEKHLTAVRGRG